MKNFKPTQEMIEAAENLAICMALSQIIREKFYLLCSEILGSHHYTGTAYINGVLTSVRVINPDLDYTINGISDYGTDKYEGSDAEHYYICLRDRALAAGFINGENAQSIIELELMRYENILIRITQVVHKINPDDVVMPEHRKTLVDLNFRLLVPFIDPVRRAEKQKAYYLKHVNK